MKNTKTVRIVATASLLALPLIAVAAQPASAVTTSMTLTLSGGPLLISAPASADLGTATASSEGILYTAQLGEVIVSDDRAAAAGAGWVASAISTALTPTAGPAIAATYIGYSAGTVATTGTVTTTDNDPSTIIGVSPVVTATAITGSNTATWNPTLDITIAGTFVAGVYTGTITHSVL